MERDTRLELATSTLANSKRGFGQFSPYRETASNQRFVPSPLTIHTPRNLPFRDQWPTMTLDM
jgi:hypothetical protein